MHLRTYCTWHWNNTLSTCTQPLLKCKCLLKCIPLHTRSTILGLTFLVCPFPGPIKISPFLPLCLFSPLHWYGNIGTGTLLLFSDLSHRPHSWGNQPSNSWCVWSLPCVLSRCAFYHPCTRIQYKCKWSLSYSLSSKRTTKPGLSWWLWMPFFFLPEGICIHVSNIYLVGDWKGNVYFCGKLPSVLFFYCDNFV